MAEPKKRKRRTVKTDTAYTKEQLVNCRKYARSRDIVSAVLEDDRKYTFEQTDELITKFLKGEM